LRKFETLGQYHDSWSAVILLAPDRFSDVRSGALLLDQKEALKEAFDQLRSGFHLARLKLKDPRMARISQELIEMSFESYSTGDRKSATHMLQECEGIIWPKYRLKTKYAVEAERRAFGENIIYANVVVSPYPYEGTSDDLGEDQAALLKLADGHCKSAQEERKEYKYLSWVIDNGGIIRRTSSEPKEDKHPILPPVQRSWGYKQLKALGESGEIRACVLTQISGGLVVYDLEQRGRPRVSARQLFKREGSFTHYENMRFHLEDPQFFEETPEGRSPRSDP
jgi:hypothetical protein